MAEESARQAHEQVLRDLHRPAHARRRADRWAGFLLPHLRPGMRLLDVGCGPGSITRGLADAVAPGPTVGVDPDPARVDGASLTVVTARGEQLPFDDASFDAVFACAVMQHVADPEVVLREVRRVARPGAVVGIADADWDGFLVHPPDPLLDRGQEVLRAIRSIGDPRVGKRLRHLMATAGFDRVVATARTNADGGAGTEAAGAFRAAELRGARPRSPSPTSIGASTAAEMAAIAAGVANMGHVARAFFAGFWVEALGWVPDGVEPTP